MDKVIFLKPYLDDKIWGGTRLQDYGYHLTSDHVGEALLVSTLPNKSSYILNTEIKERNLHDYYEAHRDFFANYRRTYPLLTKIIDANDDLSIQVHPDDAYASAKHHQLGKTECWYILDAKPYAQLVYGLKTDSREVVAKAIADNTLESILNYIDVKKGDLIYVPAGTVHAITKGLLIYELQQSCDITYRLYDYNRLENGKPRALAVEDSLNVIKYDPVVCPTSCGYLVDCPFFKLKKIKVLDQFEIDLPEALWLEITVIDGEGTIDGQSFKKGSVMLVRHRHIPLIKGECTLLVGFITH